MLDEQSNNVLIPEASFFLVKDVEFEKNDEENLELEQEITTKKKCKGKEKVKKKRKIWRLIGAKTYTQSKTNNC